jgi:hypothetical protein
MRRPETGTASPILNVIKRAMAQKISHKFSYTKPSSQFIQPFLKKVISEMIF